MSKPVILIVDDEPINIDILSNMLSQDYTLKVATNGRRALDIISKTKPDLILLDIMMPIMDGYEVAKLLTSNEQTKHIPFIFLTSKQDSDSIVHGFVLGAVDYMLKPFSKEELKVRIYNHIKIHLLQKNLNDNNLIMQKNLDTIDKYVITLSTDTNSIITKVSQLFCDTCGYTQEELIGKRASILKSTAMNETIFKKLYQTINSGMVYRGELQNMKKNKELYWLDITILPEFDEQQNIVAYTSVATDITTKKLIESISEHDPLTKLYNRLKLDYSLEAEITRAKRYNTPFSLILVDIDYFKNVNDTHGHQVGDTILVEIANLLRTSTRESDIAGRWGGEEFMIICPHTDQAGAFELANNIRKNIEAFEFNIIKNKTASFGVATYIENDTANSLIKKVDDALYEAKKSGRNKVVVCDK